MVYCIHRGNLQNDKWWIQKIRETLIGKKNHAQKQSGNEYTIFKQNQFDKKREIPPVYIFEN